MLLDAGVPNNKLFFDLTFGIASALVDFASLIAVVTNKHSFRLTSAVGGVCQIVGAGLLAVGVGTARMTPPILCYALVFTGICIQSCAGM